MMLARIEDDPNDDAAPFGVVEGVEHNRVREGVGREVDRTSGGPDKCDVDPVKPLFRREVNLLR